MTKVRKNEGKQKIKNTRRSQFIFKVIFINLNIFVDFLVENVETYSNDHFILLNTLYVIYRNKCLTDRLVLS